MADNKPAITLATVDSQGYLPDPTLINRLYTHSGNDKTYVVKGFVWLSETDEWGLLHYDLTLDTMYVRSVRNFFGLRADVPRLVAKA